jgi:hypothetical protein
MGVKKIDVDQVQLALMGMSMELAYQTIRYLVDVDTAVGQGKRE